MKFLLSLSLVIFSSVAFGQAFHFDLTERTLIKTVNQSPAHWYLEIFNDVGVDTTLRWKAHWNNIPAAWDINFDDQNTNYTFVQDGDSADFTLYGNPTFPQKLIIGAEFNGVHGEGSTLFDVYDPQDPSTQVTIRFKFIVSPLGIEEMSVDHLIAQLGAAFEFDSELVGSSITLHTLSGAVLFEGQVEELMDFSQFSNEEVVVLTILSEEGKYSRKTYLK